MNVRIVEEKRNFNYRLYFFIVILVFPAVMQYMMGGARNSQILDATWLL
jgi:hypothetical protein